MPKDNRQSPLIAHFESRSLLELGIDTHQLIVSSHHQPTFLPKTGMQAMLAKLPWGKDEPVAMDIDISCGLYDSDGNLIEVVWYGNIRSNEEAVRHKGDTFIGMNKDYNPSVVKEVLGVRLLKLPAIVHRLVFFVHSYHQQPLKLATFGRLELSDSEFHLIHELSFESLDEDVYGLAVWQLVRTLDDWQVSAPMIALKAKNAGEIAKIYTDYTVSSLT